MEHHNKSFLKSCRVCFNPRNAIVWINKGWCWHSGKNDEAIACFDRVIEIGPINEKARKLREILKS